MAPGVARGVACSRVLLAPARHVRARLSNRRFEWGGAQPATQIGICVKFTLYSPKFSLYGRERGAVLFVYVRNPMYGKKMRPKRGKNPLLRKNSPQIFDSFLLPF